MSEEFEKWNASKSEDFYKCKNTYDLMLSAWQAARELDAKRIVELETINKAMRKVLEAYASNPRIGLCASIMLSEIDKRG